MTAYTVRLTAEEFVEAVHAGLTRFKLSSRAGLRHARTYERTYLERLEQEVVGACGERAVAKALGGSWGAVNTFHNSPDVRRWEVRSTKHEHGSLIVRPWEIDDHPELLDRAFILVVGQPPDLKIIGWLRGREVCNPKWMRDVGRRGKPAYFVPQSELRPLPLKREAA